MVNGISMTSKKFEGVMKKNAEKISFNLKKENGMLNEIKVKSDEVPVYNYVKKQGFNSEDIEYIKDKLGSFCEEIKDGAKLFKEIMEYGLNLKK
ncbi:hypothetical protein IJ384_01175 [bacterium]|nr:hypothetical protein [bacterium]